VDRREPEESGWIREWLCGLAAEHEIVVSTQVMVELRAVLTRKFEPPLTAADVRAALEVLAEFDVIGAHPEWVLDAHELAVGEQSNTGHPQLLKKLWVSRLPDGSLRSPTPFTR
jgi:predicted nucleic acid-binding protein